MKVKVPTPYLGLYVFKNSLEAINTRDKEYKIKLVDSKYVIERVSAGGRVFGLAAIHVFYEDDKQIDFKVELPVSRVVSSETDEMVETFLNEALERFCEYRLDFEDERIISFKIFKEFGTIDITKDFEIENDRILEVYGHDSLFLVHDPNHLNALKTFFNKYKKWRLLLERDTSYVIVNDNPLTPDATKYVTFRYRGRRCLLMIDLFEMKGSYVYLYTTEGFYKDSLVNIFEFDLKETTLEDAFNDFLEENELYYMINAVETELMYDEYLIFLHKLTGTFRTFTKYKSPDSFKYDVLSILKDISDTYGKSIPEAFDYLLRELREKYEFFFGEDNDVLLKKQITHSYYKEKIDKELYSFKCILEVLDYTFEVNFENNSTSSLFDTYEVSLKTVF